MGAKIKRKIPKIFLAKHKCVSTGNPKHIRHDFVAQVNLATIEIANPDMATYSKHCIPPSLNFSESEVKKIGMTPALYTLWGKYFHEVCLTSLYNKPCF